jgi:hypothetical protein
VTAAGGAWASYFGQPHKKQLPLHLVSAHERAQLERTLQFKPKLTTSRRKAELAAKGIFSFAGAGSKLASAAAKADGPQTAAQLRTQQAQGRNAERIREQYLRFGNKTPKPGQ